MAINVYPVNAGQVNKHLEMFTASGPVISFRQVTYHHTTGAGNIIEIEQVVTTTGSGAIINICQDVSLP